MPQGRVWASEAPLDSLTLGYDWDSVAAMIASLRTHLFEYGTIPSWNFALCGGRPELAVPFSWAWTWPSVFAYALPPNHAILAVWIALTALGFLALRACLLRWTHSRLAAGVGALVYSLSGYFAAHFNVGHVTFAFFHLVPLLLWSFESGLDRRLAGERAGGAVALSTAVSFLLFSGGLPHAVLHLYPAVLLWMAMRALAAARSGAVRAARAVGPLVAAQVLGIWLALYKLWPVVRWQLGAPRAGVFPESHGLGALLWRTIAPPAFPAWDALQPWPGAYEWELHAFVGPCAWLLAAVAVATRPREPEDAPRARLLSLYALCLLALGLLLSLGNAHPTSPAQVFRQLPVLSAVRAFGRYQCLAVLGVAILCAQGLARIGRLAAARPRLRALPALLAAATAVPVVADAALLAAWIPARPMAEIVEAYGNPDRPRPPQLVALDPTRFVSEAHHQSSLLGRGFWIANCNEDLTLPGPSLDLPPRRFAPLAQPPPIGVADVSSDSITLVFAPSERGRVHVNLRVPESFEVDAPVERADGWRISVPRASLVGGRLVIRAVHPGPREGALASLAGAVVALALAALWHRRAPERKAR